MLKGRQIAVVGAGIGGLTAALALAQRGARVVVYERAEALSEVGAGLQVSPNGGRVLEALGLGPVLAERSLVAEALEPFDGVSGAQLARFPLGQGVPHRLVYRPDLIEILGHAAREAGVDVQTGVTVAAEGAEVHLPAPADLVVGADGLHSVVRPSLNGADAPSFTGQVAWRAVVAGDHPAVTRLTMAPGCHVVSYPLVGHRVNLIAVAEQRAWAAEGWSHAGDVAAFRGVFGAVTGPAAELVGQVDAVSVWGLHLHPVAERWQDGAERVLLGDAAHPTLPFLGQGANLAMEDAWVLAACLDAGPVAPALARYQALRRPRVVRAVRAAWGNARNYHLRGVSRRVAATGLGVLGRFTPKRFMGRFDWLYGYDAPSDLS